MRLFEVSFSGSVKSYAQIYLQTVNVNEYLSQVLANI